MLQMVTSRPDFASGVSAVLENADIDSSSESYARRFASPVGHWFLDLQARITLEALRGLPRDARVLDVGGGHAQIAPPLIDAGYKVTVVGSDPSCGTRLRPWTDDARCEFRVADLRRLPFDAGTFDAVVCYRLVAHSVNWTRLLGELCRVASHRVILDYPSRRSVNVLSRKLFNMKRSIEGVMTRRFSLYDPGEIQRAFANCGFDVIGDRRQFLLPMVLYRLAGSVRFARLAEWPGHALGLTRSFGSPVIVWAERRGSGAYPSADRETTGR
jgi:SAM-dependent methyltransferase